MYKSISHISLISPFICPFFFLSNKVFFCRFLSLYDKWDDFNFDIVNLPFLDGDVPQRPSYGVYISQLFRFARASSNVTDSNNRNKFLTAHIW